MANPSVRSAARPVSAHASAAFRAGVDNNPPSVYWPVVALVGAIAAVLVLGITVGGYALSRARTPAVMQETPAAQIAESRPQAALEPIHWIADDDPPKATRALTSATVAELSKAKAEALPAKSASATAAAGFKTRNYATAEELSKQLFLAPEVGIDHGTAERLFAAGPGQRNLFPHPAPEPLVHDAALAGLPVRMGLDCHLGKEASENLQVLSRKLRIYISESVPKDGIDTRPDATALRRKLLSGPDAERGDWKQPEAIPTLMQLLQAEDKPLRLLLVELLAGVKCREASAALAQRALFDLSGEVREAAVAALKDRPREEFRDLLLKGLRYPWAAVADHAAEALVALRDGDSLSMLVDLLDRPDPSAPFVKGTIEQETVVREVVRVNHFKNCVLCHAPSADQNDLVRGLTPDPRKPLPPRFSPAYYTANTGMFVRADITYLKQDFAAQQPVARPDVWPTNQRYDYLVRTRPATMRDIEIASRKERNASYPQRESVLFALRELTGRDAGTATDAWRP
ncbi:MAG TPA: hypothetical protein VGG61_10870, partial [Gemmataceae bacterium]